MSIAAPTAAYPGGELETFAQAARWKDYVLQQVRPFLGRKVLEVGAGIGSSTRALCGDDCERWVCLEPDSANATTLLRLRQQGALPARCEVIQGLLEPSDPRFQGFDTVMYLDVLEHIEDDRAEVRRAVDCLLPGGHLVVLVPAHQFLFSAFDHSVGHRRRYSRAALLSLLPRNGRAVRTRYLDSLGLLASAGNRFVLRSSTPTLRQVMLWDRELVPMSRVFDPLTGYTLGKSLLAIWKRDA